MKGSQSKGANFYARLPTDKDRLQNCPVSRSIELGQEKKGDGTIISFLPEQYDFPNRPLHNLTSLKTVVTFTINSQKLQKVAKLSHPNIISLRKIVKNNPKEPNLLAHRQTYYSFYYEAIQYSLLYLSEHANQHPRLWNLLIGMDVRSLLRGVVEYLGKAGIYYESKVEDIGVSIEGNLKVYIQPQLIFESKYDPNIGRALTGLSDWWENYQKMINDNMFRKDKKPLQLRPPKLSENDQFQFDDDTIQESLLEKELDELLQDEKELKKEDIKQSTKIQTPQLSKMGSLHLQKIDEEIKLIRACMNQQKNKLKQSETRGNSNLQLLKSKSKTKLFDSERYPEEQVKLSKRFYREPILQNINCINIYNHHTTISPKHYEKIPNCITKPQLNGYFDHLDPEAFRDRDEDLSQDTYDIEFESQFQSINNHSNDKFRHSFVSPLKKQPSQYSEHVQRKNKERSPLPSIEKEHHINQVCKKNYTESAGPLQFKNFVNKFIKPEFMAKKSNIYEQPSEDEVQQHERTTRKEEKYKPKIEYNPRSNSAEQGIKQLKQQSVKGNLDNLCQNSERASKIKRINSKKTFLSNPQPGHGLNKIQERVKLVVQKTKNALALLNRVKSCKALSRQYIS